MASVSHQMLWGRWGSRRFQDRSEARRAAERKSTGGSSPHSIAYLSLEGLMSAVGTEKSHYCSSCYTAEYPVAFPRDEKTYLQLALKLDKEAVTS